MTGKIKSFFFGSFSRIAAFNVTMAVLPLLIALAFSGVLRYVQASSEVREKSADLIYSISIQQKRMLEVNAVTMLKTLASTSEVTSRDAQTCEILFQRIVNMQSDCETFALYDETGKFIAGAGFPGTASPFLFENSPGLALNPDRFMAHKVIIGENSPHRITFIMPIEGGAEGRPTAYLAASVQARYSELLSKVDIPKGFYLLFLNGQDKPVYMYGYSENEGRNAPLPLPVKQDKVAASRLEARYDLTSEPVPGVGRSALILREPISLETNASPYMTIVLLVNEKAAYTDARTAFFSTIFLACCAFSGTFILTRLICFLAFKRPVNRLLNISRRLAQGDFKAGLELDADKSVFYEISAAFSKIADVLDKREAELKAASAAANKASQVKSEFLANMSHEILTPMNAVLGMSHLALKSGLPPVQQGYINKIQASGKALLRIIDDILDFSKMEVGKMDVEPVRFSLRDLLAVLAEHYAKHLASADTKLIIDIEPEVPMYFMGDPLRLEQGLRHLLDNAVNFTRHGSIRIACALLGIVKDECTLRITVADTSVGMSPNMLHSLQMALAGNNKLMPSYTDNSYDSGLGLIIANRIFKIIGGEL